MAVKNLKIPDVETFEKERRAKLLFCHRQQRLFAILAKCRERKKRKKGVAPVFFS